MIVLWTEVDALGTSKRARPPPWMPDSSSTDGSSVAPRGELAVQRPKQTFIFQKKLYKLIFKRTK